MLDDNDFTEDREAFVAAGAEIAGHTAHIAATAFTAEEVATGLGISASRVRQKRLAGELWAIADGQSWVFPVLQFTVLRSAEVPPGTANTARRNTFGRRVRGSRSATITSTIFAASGAAHDLTLTSFS